MSSRVSVPLLYLSRVRWGSVAEAVGDAELVEQRLGLEIGDPDRGDLPFSDGPTVDDLDHRAGAPNTLVDDRVDTAVRGDGTDVAAIGAGILSRGRQPSVLVPSSIHNALSHIGIRQCRVRACCCVHSC